MLPHWKHLTIGQRRTIASMLAHSRELKEIAEALGMNPTPVSKEIRRNRTQLTQGGECQRIPSFSDHIALQIPPIRSLNLLQMIWSFFSDNSSPNTFNSASSLGDIEPRNESYRI